MISVGPVLARSIGLLIVAVFAVACFAIPEAPAQPVAAEVAWAATLQRMSVSVVASPRFAPTNRIVLRS